MNNINTWREPLINLENLKLNNITIDEVISYLPAGNDVFECVGKMHNKEINFIIKSERSKYANFKNEKQILSKVKKYISVPKIIESGILNNHYYLVLSKINGERLSTLLKNDNVNKEQYLFLYGASLAQIHKISIFCDRAMQRAINDYPKEENYFKFDKWETKIVNYLCKNKPNINYDTFIHGDFHYANILWNNEKIAGILDWEYAGLGFKEQDIAWALILRPEQTFMNNKDDLLTFLEGYKKYNTFNKENLLWCYINGLMHFYLMNKNNSNKEYVSTLKRIITEILKTPFFDKK